jgi:hypothetical protein
VAIKGQGTGTIFKGCDCEYKARCSHGWTLRYWADGKQTNRTFRDTTARPPAG